MCTGGGGGSVFIFTRADVGLCGKGGRVCPGWMIKDLVVLSECRGDGGSC